MLEVVRKMLAEHAESGAILAIFDKLVARNSELELRLSELMSRRHKGEGVSTAQLLLFLSEQGRDASETGEGTGALPASAPCSPAVEEANAELRAASGIDDRCREQDEAPKPPAQPPVRNPFPEHLKRVPHVILVPAAERACPKCGGERKCIGHDVTEHAELKSAEVFIRVEMREKLQCPPCEGELVRAPVGERVVSGGRFGPKLVAQLLVDKYDDGLPLHRQKERFERMGLPVAVSTLADQVTWVTDLLTPLWHAARQEVLEAVVLHVDATSLPVLVRDKKTHKKVGAGKKLGSLWGYVGGETALYLYCSTGHKKGQTEHDIGPEDFLAARSGYTVADAASVFDKSFAREEIIECGCNTHARRYFFKALDGGDTRAALPIAAFKKLYDIEERLRDVENETRRAARQEESRPVYESLLKWCVAHEPDERPTSPLGKAIRYTHNHREALMRFIEDGRIPIDNGAIERLHVRAALTRKNFLFAGSDAGGRRAAIAYTILGSCRLAGVNPIQYLAAVLPKLARGVKPSAARKLLPAAWREPLAAKTPAVPAAAQ